MRLSVNYLRESSHGRFPEPNPRSSPDFRQHPAVVTIIGTSPTCHRQLHRVPTIGVDSGALTLLYD